MRYVDLEFAELHKVDLSAADLYYANVQGASLDDCDLSWANLKGADFSDCQCQNTKFEGAVYDQKTKLPFSVTEANRLGMIMSKVIDVAG